MANRELNRKLIAAFPELEDHYLEEIQWQDGDETGAHVVYGDVLKPYLLHHITTKNKDVVQKILAFIEKSLSENDPLLNEIIAFSVLESILTDNIDLSYVEPMLGDHSRKTWNELKEYLHL